MVTDFLLDYISLYLVISGENNYKLILKSILRGNKMKKRKVVVSLSGGADSSTVLGYAVQKYGKDNVYAIGFNYGSKHPQELECAKKICEYYGVKNFQIIEINPHLFEGSTSTLLATGGEVEKDKTYADIIKRDGEGKVSTYIPGRNFLFSAYVNARAESIYEQTKEDVIIMLGVHGDDEAGQAYPDCSKKFVNTMKRASKISSEGHVHYAAPFAGKPKKEVIKVGLTLKKPVPYEMTISCYEPIIKSDGSWEACGRCATCLDRQKAIDEAKKELGLI